MFLRAKGSLDDCGEHDEDQVTVEAESPQGRQYEGGEDWLGHLKVSQGGRAHGQATGSVCYLPIRYLRNC